MDAINKIYKNLLTKKILYVKYLIGLTIIGIIGRLAYMYHKHPIKLIKTFPQIFITQDMCNFAAGQNIHNIKMIPEKFITENMCDHAIRNDASFIKMIPTKFKNKYIKKNLFTYFLNIKHIHNNNDLINYLQNNDPFKEISNEILKLCHLNDFEGVCMNGKQFNDHFGHIMLYKITKGNEIHNLFQLKDGLNIDTKPFNKDDEYAGGIHSTNNPEYWSTLYEYWDQDCFLRDVKIPDTDTTLVCINYNSIKSNKIILGKREPYKRLIY